MKRFAPSEFAAGKNAAKTIDVLRLTLEVMDACRAAKRENPELEIAGFHIGLFMSYLGFGALATKKMLFTASSTNGLWYGT